MAIADFQVQKKDVRGAGGKLNALLNLMIVIDFFSLEISLEHSLEYPPSAFAQQDDWRDWVQR